MKRRKRVSKTGKVASLKASGDGKPGCSANGAKLSGSGGDPLAASRGWRRPPKKRVTMYLDADVLAWFREQGPGYQKEISRVLREVMRREVMRDERGRIRGSN